MFCFIWTWEKESKYSLRDQMQSEVAWCCKLQLPILSIWTIQSDAVLQHWHIHTIIKFLYFSFSKVSLLMKEADWSCFQPCDWSLYISIKESLYPLMLWRQVLTRVAVLWLTVKNQSLLSIFIPCLCGKNLVCNCLRLMISSICIFTPEL